jgi:hypothetical protein
MPARNLMITNSLKMIPFLRCSVIVHLLHENGQRTVDSGQLTVDR